MDFKWRRDRIDGLAGIAVALHDIENISFGAPEPIELLWRESSQFSNTKIMKDFFFLHSLASFVAFFLIYLFIYLVSKSLLLELVSNTQ